MGSNGVLHVLDKVVIPDAGESLITNDNSLWNEICRTPKIQVGCTHAGTIKNHNYNAFL